MDLPTGRRPVSYKWVLRCKYRPDGTVERYKARLVARGFSQMVGFDYEDTFSPVLGMTSFRLIVALAAPFSYPIHQADVKTAFLHGDLLEEIYMSQPPLYQSPAAPKKVCRLHKAIYGLKQSPRQWYMKFHTFMIEKGHTYLQSNPNIYIRQGHVTFVLLGASMWMTSC